MPQGLQAVFKNQSLIKYMITHGFFYYCATNLNNCSNNHQEYVFCIFLSGVVGLFVL